MSRTCLEKRLYTDTLNYSLNKKAAPDTGAALKKSIVSGQLADKVLLSLALEISCLVFVDDVIFCTLIDSGSKLGKALLSCLFVTSFSSSESLLAKSLHAARESLVASGTGLVLTDALEC